MKYTTKVALLGSIIDYAGTFPPAALSLENALKRAAIFRSERKCPWIFAKVALPLGDIKKLTARRLYESGADGSAWLYTALGSPVEGNEASDFLRAVEWDVREMRHCQERGFESAVRQSIIAYETKLPATLSRENAAAFLSPVLDRLQALTGVAVTPFFEVSLEGEWEPRLEAALGALADWCDEHENLPFTPGVKIRTGGSFVPSVEQLAQVVVSTTSRALRFKATQGLHEAITHGNSYGFVNLFSALAFSQALGEAEFGKDQVVKCLQSARAEDFKFGDETFEWGGHSLTLEAIESARRQHGASFGSCSLDEPAEALLKDFPEGK